MVCRRNRRPTRHRPENLHPGALKHGQDRHREVFCLRTESKKHRRSCVFDGLGLLLLKQTPTQSNVPL